MKAMPRSFRRKAASAVLDSCVSVAAKSSDIKASHKTEINPFTAGSAMDNVGKFTYSALSYSR